MSIDLLQEKIRKTKSPIMVGLDPTEDLIPLHILNDAFAEHGQTPEALAAAFLRFCRELLDELKDIVPAVKIQTGCFELLGAPGVAAMQAVAAYARSLDYYVMLDSLRSDAPHISELYAKMVFSGFSVGSAYYEPYGCDAVTVNGYLGSESVQPYLPYCRGGKNNVFLMVKSSNRSGRELQDLASGDRTVHTAMADLIMRWSAGLYGKYGYSEIGAIMGANDARSLEEIRKKYDRIFILLVGYGAQGGTAKPASAAFDSLGHGAIVAASRSIIGAWKQADSDGSDYCSLAREAALKMKKDISRYVTVI